MLLGSGAGAGPAVARQVPFFEPPAVTTTADVPEGVFAADVDGDGDLDVLSANKGGDTVAWHENDGSGGGWTLHTIATGLDGPGSVFAADVDGDGDLDALSASELDSALLAWHENDGSGGGWTLHTISTPRGASAVVAADVEGDGDLDVLVVARDEGWLYWYENDGSGGGTWTEHRISFDLDLLIDLFVADVDGDGDVDVLSLDRAVHSVVWFENDGAGAGWTLHTISTTTYSGIDVWAADVDGDGDLDVLSSGTGSEFVPLPHVLLWHENDGTGGGWTVHTIPTPADSGGRLFSVDVDGDGDLDLFATSNDDAYATYSVVRWYENDGSGGGWTLHTVSTSQVGLTSVLGADLDGDGDVDAVATSIIDDRIAWYRNDTIHRSALFPATAVVGSGADGAFAVSAADVDGDGDVDGLSASLDDDTVAWHENDGSGGGWTLHTVSTSGDGVSSVLAVDVDGDGDADVLAASAYDHTDAWYENGSAGGGWAPHTVTTAANGVRSAVPADLDRDGDPDVLWASPFTGTVAWQENGGTGAGWTLHTVSASAFGAISVVAADVDGDGDLDVLSESRDLETIQWYENDGAGGTWTSHTVSTAAPDVFSVIAADVDGDGDLDAVATAVSPPLVAWYENDGTGGGWTLHTVSTAYAARALHAVDLDGDGDLDLLSASPGSDTVAWHENDGSGGGWVAHPMSTVADAPYSVFAADLDGDGDVDALSASRTGDSIDWYENLGGQLALATTDVAQKVVGDSEAHDLLAVLVTHRGRAGDGEGEVASLELQLFKAPGTPLTSLEANALIEELRVYVDDGSGAFEASADALVATVASFTLVTGVETVALADGDPAVRVGHGSPKTLFVVAEMTADAEGQTPGAFSVRHVAESSIGEDADHDIPLSLEPADEVGTGKIDTALDSSSCQAPFDLDLANRTVDSALVCEAGTVIRAGSSFVVVSPGDLTFRAGQGVELATGFEVQSGAFTAEIDPGLEP